MLKLFSQDYKLINNFMSRIFFIKLPPTVSVTMKENEMKCEKK